MVERMNKTHIAYADIARIFAAFCVVLLHTAGARLITAPIGSDVFNYAAFYDVFARFTVPLFVMLSGMLFLNSRKTVKISKLYTKNILRLVTAFIFWSYVYNVYTDYAVSGSIVQSFVSAVEKIPNGAMHLWFIYIMIGLYMVTPFIKRMCQNMTKGEAIYFILLSVLITFLPKTLSSYDAFVPYLEYLTKFEINYVAGYVGLFVAGWYIDHFDHNIFEQLVCYLLAIGGFVYMLYTTVTHSVARGVIADEFMSFKSVSSFVMAFGVLMLFKALFGRINFSRKTVSNLSFYSKHTFGIYLIHELFISIFTAKGWVLLAGYPLVGIPLQALLVFLLSGIITSIILWIPFGKYIA